MRIIESRSSIEPSISSLSGHLVPEEWLSHLS